MIRNLLITTLVVLSVALLSGCQPAATVQPTAEAAEVFTQYAGQIPNSQAFISILTDGEHVLAYICDGTEQGVSISEWIMGEGTNTFNLTSTDGTTVSGKIASGQVEGTLTLADGQIFNFTAPQIEDENAGLFRSLETFNGVDYVAGWIILPDGQQRGAANTKPASKPRPVSRLPRTLTVNSDVGTFLATRLFDPCQ